MTLTVLMPCLNEEKSVGFCIGEAMEAIKSLGIEAEVLIADNGSTDASAEIAKALGARVVYAKQRGYGAALLCGIREAKGKYIIMGDCDGSYDFGDIEKFLAKLQSGYSLVVGNRFKGGIEKGAMPLLHKIGVPLLSLAARLRFFAPVGDFHCGIRGFERDAALSLGLCHSGMEFATEIIARFAKAGYKICEIPTPLRRDLRCARSHIRTFSDGWRHLKFILTNK